MNFLLTDCTLSVKYGSYVGESFLNSFGTPQEDGIYYILFILNSTKVTGDLKEKIPLKFSLFNALNLQVTHACDLEILKRMRVLIIEAAASRVIEKWNPERKF